MLFCVLDIARRICVLHNMTTALFLGAALAAAGPCCSWDSCGTCGDTTAYCKSTQSACEKDCGGQWCPTGPSGPSGYAVPNVCDSKATAAKSVAYACMDWSVGSGAMLGAAAAAGMNETHFFGVGSFGTGATNMGKCYEVAVQGAPKKALLQVVNQGGDVSSGQFDLQMGDGGVGLFDGCVAPTTSGQPAIYAGDASAFGKQYGGWASKADCAKLPSVPQARSQLPAGEPTLNRLCELGFELGARIEGGENPAITSARRVPCPAALVALTGLNRTDGAETESHGAGTLTRMMDCCKPSAGWLGNVDKADPAHPAVIPCQQDGFTRLSVGPTPAPAPPAPTPAPPAPTPAPPSGCPGGSLSACIALCPSDPAAAYQACVQSCVTRCP
jgi:hypothetical protein